MVCMALDDDCRQRHLYELHYCGSQLVIRELYAVYERTVLQK
jgi:hypothetical protein